MHSLSYKKEKKKWKNSIVKKSKSFKIGVKKSVCKVPESPKATNTGRRNFVNMDNRLRISSVTDESNDSGLGDSSCYSYVDSEFYSLVDAVDATCEKLDSRKMKCSDVESDVISCDDLTDSMSAVSSLSNDDDALSFFVSTSRLSSEMLPPFVGSSPFSPRFTETSLSIEEASDEALQEPPSKKFKGDIPKYSGTCDLEASAVKHGFCPVSDSNSTSIKHRSLEKPLTENYPKVSKNGGIKLEIICQPEKQHRARYQTEGSRGAVKDITGEGYPEVKLFGYRKSVILQVFVGTDNGQLQPHLFYQASKVSGKQSTSCNEINIDGTVVLEIDMNPENDMCVSCDCIGILKERNVDVEKRLANSNCVKNVKKSTKCRLVFRVLIPDDDDADGGEILQVVSTLISCTQPPGVPEICLKSLSECSVDGGKKLFIFGKNFSKNTIVVFQDSNPDVGSQAPSIKRWKKVVEPDKDYLQQNHLVCEVPPYHCKTITRFVRIHLFVVSSGKKSESHLFTYKPLRQTGIVTDQSVQTKIELGPQLYNDSQTSTVLGQPERVCMSGGILHNVGTKNVGEKCDVQQQLNQTETSLSLHNLPKYVVLPSSNHSNIQQLIPCSSSNALPIVSSTSKVLFCNQNSTSLNTAVVTNPRLQMITRDNSFNGKPAYTLANFNRPQGKPFPPAQINTSPRPTVLKSSSTTIPAFLIPSKVCNGSAILLRPNNNMNVQTVLMPSNYSSSALQHVSLNPQHANISSDVAGQSSVESSNEDTSIKLSKYSENEVDNNNNNSASLRNISLNDTSKKYDCGDDILVSYDSKCSNKNIVSNRYGSPDNIDLFNGSVSSETQNVHLSKQSTDFQQSVDSSLNGSVANAPNISQSSQANSTRATEHQSDSMITDYSSITAVDTIPLSSILNNNSEKFLLSERQQSAGMAASDCNDIDKLLSTNGNVIKSSNVSSGLDALEDKNFDSSQGYAGNDVDGASKTVEKPDVSSQQPSVVVQVKCKEDYSQHKNMMDAFSELPDSALLRIINPSAFDNVCV